VAVGGGGREGVLCASQCQCSTGVERRATSGGGKMVGVGAIKRWLTSQGRGGVGVGFALLEIKLQALLGCSSVLALRGGGASLCSTAAYTMTFLCVCVWGGGGGGNSKWWCGFGGDKFFGFISFIKLGLRCWWL